MNLLHIVTDRTLDTKTIVIYKTTKEATFPDMYKVGPLSLPPGSAVLITAQIEVTNPHKYNVGLGLRVIRGSTTILPAAMMNITPAEHHQVRSLAVWDMPPGDELPTYILEGYAAASRCVPGDKLIVEAGYGLLQCAVFVPVPVP